MNKSELIKQIADRAGLSQAKAGDALDAFCASVIDALAQGGEVAIIQRPRRAHGAQPANRRSGTDSRQPRAQIQRGQGVERRG